jgi:hypothetical protein
MSRVIGNWKKGNRENHGVLWQENFFDHRLRQDESFEEKAVYIRRNPLVKGLCSKPEEWPWALDSDFVHKALKLWAGRALRRTFSPEARRVFSWQQGSANPRLCGSAALNIGLAGDPP